MTLFNLREIKEQLKEASGELSRSDGVSFTGKSLKLDSEKDADPVVHAIEQCKHLVFLDLEGNTLGPDAARAIAEALKKNGVLLKRALWKDMFTGRLKTEIPVALEHLGNGLCAAGTRLVELDLSDNALGPIGVKGLASLLISSPCHTLRKLRLNNNGLGISGGEMLAKALLSCNENSIKENGMPLMLKVLILGRNRLENQGATAIAKVFKTIGTLEEVQMPQNGIYHIGITALANGLSYNKKLRVLNLNDNTIGAKGAIALAGALPNFPDLEKLDLGDCLLKTKGALILADALGRKDSHPGLAEVILSSNEIGIKAALPIANAMADKTQLTSLQLDGNEFGVKGQNVLIEALTKSERIDSLGNFDEDDEQFDSDEGNDNDIDDNGDEDGEDEGEDEDEKYGEEQEDEEEDDEIDDDEDDGEDEENDGEDEEDNDHVQISETIVERKVTVEDFLRTPTGENLLLLDDIDIRVFADHAKNLSDNRDILRNSSYLEEFAKIIMKVSSLYDSDFYDVKMVAQRLTDTLYAEFFARASRDNQVSIASNALLVSLGLIKGEDGKAERINWNLKGCFKALEIISRKDYFPSQTRDTLKLFIEKPVKTSRTKFDPYQDSKASLKLALDR
ncbi:ran GTPase-activating protein 1 [Orussus abietinus]|uniref:ran GTPase-activating protein 1 n=1 Tax=Orussus abietinus TaxID=222816 RepID=UPI0006268C00|nr:ran GTPase-activating protein 1 [Orussus abietinus]